MDVKELTYERMQGIIAERDALRAELDELTSMYVHHMDVIAEQADMEELGDFGDYVRIEYRDKPPRKVATPALSVPSGMKIEKIFRWSGEKQHHIPQLLIEFEPVPAGEPNDSKGWKDRDALSEMLSAAQEVK